MLDFKILYGGRVDRFVNDVLEVLKLLAGIGGAGKPRERWCPASGLAYLRRRTRLTIENELWSRDHLSMSI
jgi:hypothetical protein